MRLLAPLLIGAVSNLDNLGAGIAFGIRGTRIGAMANLLVAAVTMAATAAAVTGGHVVSSLLPPAVTGWLGPLIVIAIGVATIHASVRASRRRDRADARLGARRPSGSVDDVVSWRGAIVLGAALSANNLGMGVGAGVAGVGALATTIWAGLLSLACVGGGSYLGRVSGRLVLGRHAPLIAGLLLLAVGGAMLPGVR